MAQRTVRGRDRPEPVSRLTMASSNRALLLKLLAA
jgi:hypothetical protein